MKGLKHDLTQLFESEIAKFGNTMVKLFHDKIDESIGGAHIGATKVSHVATPRRRRKKVATVAGEQSRKPRAETLKKLEQIKTMVSESPDGMKLETLSLALHGSGTKLKPVAIREMVKRFSDSGLTIKDNVVKAAA